MFAPLGVAPSAFFLAVTLAIVFGLPLAQLALGVRLLARKRPVSLGRKVFVIGAGAVGFCAAYLLTVVIALRYVDSSPPLMRIEPGQYHAFLAALEVLAAGCVMARERLDSYW